MKTTFFSFVIGLGLLLAFPLKAQYSWQELFNKSEKQYQKGKYTSALSKLKSIRKKVSQTPENQTTYQIWISIQEAKYLLAKGFPDKAQSVTNDALSQLKTLTTQNTAQTVASYQMAKLLWHLGAYAPADSLLNTVNQSQLNALQKATFTLYQAEIAIALNKFYNLLGQITTNQNTWQSLANNSEDENGKKLKGYQRKIRKSLYARSLTQEALYYQQLGRYDSASSILEKHLPLVKKLSRKQTNYASHLILTAQSLLYAEKPKFALKAYEYAGRRIKKRKATYFSVIEGLTQTHIALDKNIVLNKNLHFAKKLRRSYFSKNSLYQMRLELLSIEQAIYQKKYENARKDLQGLLDSYANLLPQYSPWRSQLNKHLYMLETYADADLGNAQQRLNTTLQIYAHNYGKNSLKYAEQRLKQARYYLVFTDSLEYGYNIIEQEKPQERLFEEYAKTHRTYVNWQNHFSDYYDAKDDYVNALKLVQTGTQVYADKFGKEDQHYGLQLLRQAEFELKVGKFNAADSSLNESVEIIRESYRRRSLEYANALTTSASLYNILGSYNKAEGFLRQASRIYRRLRVRDVAQRARSVEEAASIYIRIGEYAETERLLNEIVEAKIEKYSDKSRRLITPYRQLAYLNLIKGDYQVAAELLEKSLQIAENVYGTNSLRTVEVYETYARYYALLGDYENAKQYMLKALASKEQLLDATHVELGKTYANYALVLFYENPSQNTKKAQDLLQKAKDIMKENFGEKHPLYAEVLKDLATVDIGNTKYNEAFILLSQANNIWKEKLGEDNINSAEINMLLGDIYTKLGRFKEAKEYYRTAEEIYKYTFDKNHPDYVRTQSKLGQMFFTSGDYKSANKRYAFTTEAYLGYIDKYFAILSENEKAKFWAKIRPDFEFYNSLAIKQKDKRPQLIANMYNFTLATKALLLSSSIKIRQQILASEDEVLRQTFQDWLDKKEYLNSLLALSNEERATQDISINDIQKDINRLEKELSQRSSLFNQGFGGNRYTWEDVRKTLKDNEAAIEIIRFRLFDEQGFSDKIHYAALIIQPKSRKAPKLVLLENGNRLENKFLKYYRNMVRYRENDKFSYGKYWQAIAEELEPEITTVYLSPDGVYNQINVESLMYEENKYVIDRRNIRVVSNTKDLLESQDQNYDEKTALLFGNPQFYTTQTANKQVQYISQLPGTEKEVQAISQMLRQAGWQVAPYIEQDANEAKIKTTQSPRLCHIATHGMFQSNKATEDVMIESEFKADNPLMRSGILTKGAGDALSQKPDNYNQEGILTAYEALSLGLDETELVVLSACETGRGEVQIGEGVYGLQRAFLVAGANAVVMSLFKVSDEITTKLMVKFYEKWLQSGNKRLAFNEAQKEIKAEYKHPAYWGVFNMIGVN